MRKNIISMIIVLLTVGVIVGDVKGVANVDIKVTVDGKTVDFPDAKPFIDDNNRTLIPVRFVVEELGADVVWNGKKKEVYIYYNDIYIMLKINSNKIQIESSNDNTINDMDTKAIIKNSRTYVPIRYVAEGLGATVQWTNNTVIIAREGYEKKYNTVDDLGYEEEPIESFNNAFDFYDDDLKNVVIIDKNDLPIQISSTFVIHDVKVSSNKETVLVTQENLKGTSHRAYIFLAVKNDKLRSRNAIKLIKKDGTEVYIEKDLGNNIYETTHDVKHIAESDYKTFSLDNVDYFAFMDYENNRFIAVSKDDVL